MRAALSMGNGESLNSTVLVPMSVVIDVAPGEVLP
jgi:hypothetical protein